MRLLLMIGAGGWIALISALGFWLLSIEGHQWD